MDKKNNSKSKDIEEVAIEKKDEDKKSKNKENIKETKQQETIEEIKENRKSYVSYERRVLIYFIIVIGCLVLAVSFFSFVS